MKNYLLLLVILFVTSCRSDEEGVRAHYKFTADDKNYTLENLSTGTQITFTNQNGQQKVYTVNTAMTATGTEANAQMFADKHFEYDYRIITLSSGNESISYRFQRFPDDYAYALEHNNALQPSHLEGRVGHSLYNKAGDANENINFSAATTVMTFNGATYSRVVVFNSGNSQPLNTSGIVNVMYYDLNKGLIGYDDLNGNQWRRMP